MEVNVFSRLTIIAVIIPILSGCMFSNLKREKEEEKTSYALFGRIYGPSVHLKETYVLLFKEIKGVSQLQSYGTPDDKGNYSFIVTPGIYRLAAFTDFNKNETFDQGELSGSWNQQSAVVVPRGLKTVARREALSHLDIDLSSEPDSLVKEIDKLDKQQRVKPSLYIFGQRVSWDDPAFDDEYGSLGYWQPMSFLRENLAGIYFMQSYDPEKIPVLFVHGAVGTPRIWEKMAESLDKDKYQSWVAYYPSGQKLASIGNGMNEIVKRLQLEYGFEKIAVVAHSMGGLVSRSFILNHHIKDGLGTVKVFVTFSTPWGGVEMAESGIENAPESVSSWHDVVPGSKFLKALFKNSLTAMINHHLIFSYRGDCSLFMANNDGSVELASQLFTEAQKDAYRIRGFNEDHVSILQSSQAIDYLKNALEESFSDKR